MFTKDSNGALQYKTKDYVYSLLEGIDDKGYTSDIIFIFREPKWNDLEVDMGEIVDFVYGGFDHLDREFIENAINKYEKRKGLI